jgi:DNA-directed RNA polymerase subunit beta'
VLTCQSRQGVCSRCYGRDLARGHMVNLGEAIGVIAAQSIGEPGTQLTMRTFHIGGTATRRAEASTFESRHAGTVHYHGLKTVKRKDGSIIAMNRNGEIAIADDNGRERERYAVVYGAKINVKEGQKIEVGTTMAEWDPFAVPIVADVSGTVRFTDIIEGVTMNEQLDEVTGLSRKSIIESRDADAQPRLQVEDEKGNVKQLPTADQPARYNLPVGANITVNDGDQVDAGEVLARIPRETTKTKDITGGLPRVAELFEARKPKEHAVISEIEGVVSFGKDTKGKRKVIVTPEIDAKLRTDLAREYLIGKGKHINVHAGDRVKAGDPLMDGAANPHDILKVLGEKELARYMVDEVQEVYRLQGVKINDKHIETIVRQMLRRVRVSEVGDTTFLVDEQAEKSIFDAENQRVTATGGKPATGEPLLLGITKASLSTESFISASSFQETTKVLTEAAISGKIDHLRGLKENVIMGRLIPAGTGLNAYKHLDIEVETPVDEVEAAEEALAIAAGAETPVAATAGAEE